jgi:hypothetical protein
LLLTLQKEQGKRWQWLDGFAGWNGSAPNAGDYASCLGICDSHWAYAAGGEVSWLTAPAKKAREAAAVFVGSSDFVPSEAELWLDGQRVLGFPTGVPQDAHWQNGAVELFYFHCAIIPRNGISGVYVLHVPSAMATPGKSLVLSARMAKPGGGWIMCHAFRDTLRRIIDPTPAPEPGEGVIAAFTPHLNEQFGQTIAEYEVNVLG